MEAARILKANLKLQNKPCGWCQIALQLGEDAAVCTACEKEHHQRCWDGSGGCSTTGCVNAPLRQLAPPPAPPPAAIAQSMPPGWAPPVAPPMGQPPMGQPMGAPFSAGMMACPNCNQAIMVGSQFCSFCRAITSPDGIYHGPMTTAPGATASLVYGLIGLLFCGIIFGPLAISKANAAKRAIAENPTYSGSGLATAGTVLGIIDLIGWFIVVMIRLGAK